MTDVVSAGGERGAPASRSLGPTRLLVKLAIVAVVDALLVLTLAQAIAAEWWLAVGFLGVALVAINVAYLTGRSLPLKYLLPGLLLLTVFQVYTMFFTAYASFTNYGTGHLGDKSESVAAIEAQNVTPVPNSPQYAVVPVVRGGVVSMLVSDPKTGTVQLGTKDGLGTVEKAAVVRTDGVVSGLKGYTSLNLGTLVSNASYQSQWNALAPPLDRKARTYLRALSVAKASIAKPGYVYVKRRDAMVSTANGTVYRADASTGNFVSAKGVALEPGWRVPIGVSNYRSLVSDPTLRSRFIPIAIWTFVFAFLSTLLNFGLGLALALALSERRMRGVGIYRLLLIVPFGLPFILTTLVWKGMLNTDFGLINQVLGTNVPWLTNPSLARFSVLMVNLWLGFPYFFLVCSGALTAIPGDLKEAAFVDGARGRYAFRTIVLPLLLVATAPLLVTTFAFNFNNYSLIQLLTQGGPYPGSVIEGGSTDLLINFTFRKAFNDQLQQLGLASAIAMVIFVLVGTISAYGFRLTKRLEEIGT